MPGFPARMAVRARWSGCLVGLLAALLASSGAATVVRPQNIEQLEAQSGLIFAGVCTSRTAAIERGIPVSIYTFEVIEAVKGPVKKGGRVVVRHFGNGVPNPNGGVAAIIPGIPTYRVGQQVLLFLNPPSRLGLTSPVGLWQGLFSVKRDAEGKRWLLLDPLRRKLLVGAVDAAKYDSAVRLTTVERRLLTDPPSRVELETFCSLVRKIGQVRSGKARRAE